METQGRCKGCMNYLTVPPGQRCPICHTVNNLQYANGLSSYNYYNTPYGQPSAYAGYHAPQVYSSGYYNLQQQPTVYSGSYYSPQPSSAPIVYGSGYCSLQQQPTEYSGSYYNPQPSSAPIVYGSGYYNQYYQQVHQQKRAVLCGVTYKGHRKTLPGSINNVRFMHHLLLKRGFPHASIHVLTEDESDPTRIPTRYNMLVALKWLTDGSQSGDSLVFYYAGHGSQMPDLNGDEKDGRDEALCPVDYSVSGRILDDEVNAILVAPLPHGVKLHSIMDTCCSGTILDLSFLCRVDWRGYYNWEDQHPSHAYQYGGTSGGKAICISACDDHQKSADTTAFTGNAVGALTYSFIQAVESTSNLTYGHLLDSMRKRVREAQQQQGLNAPFASSVSQEPQLSSSTRFEIYSESRRYFHHSTTQIAVCVPFMQELVHLLVFTCTYRQESRACAKWCTNDRSKDEGWANPRTGNE
ncbi:hypothetical protein L1987_15033 [Smallanthus sonchifolius]|uniref:Uncharacterized protein n=1 Tax=Smallanthus sonchifolius TaxID=185202 RepID=A0ACB9J7Z5_9ASTR|nr:hypothetical protein L1987_15033 [Smallanthus sonchifolius]